MQNKENIVVCSLKDCLKTEFKKHLKAFISECMISFKNHFVSLTTTCAEGLVEEAAKKINEKL